jgi:tetratricopeptide (TPR) repeat protein
MRNITLSRYLIAAARDIYYRKPTKRLSRKFLMDGLRIHANNLSASNINEQASRVYDELIDHCLSHIKLREVQKLIETEEYQLARVKLALYLKIYDCDIVAWYLLGKVCAEQGEYKASTQALKKLRQLAPGFIDIDALHGTMPLRVSSASPP